MIEAATALRPFLRAAAAGIEESRTVKAWNGGLPPFLLLDANGDVHHRFRSHHCPAGVLPPDAFSDAIEACALTPGYSSMPTVW